MDAGANIGLFTLSLLTRGTPIRVVCFEPVPAIRACLKRNLAAAKRHAGCRIDVRDCALSKLDGYADVTFLPRAPGNSTMFPKRSLMSSMPYPKSDIRWSYAFHCSQLKACDLGNGGVTHAFMIGQHHTKPDGLPQLRSARSRSSTMDEVSSATCSGKGAF